MFGDIMSSVAGTGEASVKTSMVIPAMLCLVLTGLLTYHHATQTEYDHEVSHFLVIVLLSMMPLLILKVKMYTCGDRLALVPIVIVKTLLMHVAISILRLAPWAIHYEKFDPWSPYLWFDIGSLGACVFLLKRVFGYTFALRNLVDEREVRSLIILSVGGAFVVESACLYLPTSWVSGDTLSYISNRSLLYKTVFTAANYADVLAFMPVVWKLYQAEQDDDDHMGAHVPEDAKHQVILFFAFVCGFYSWDDVIDPLRTYRNDRGEAIIMMAHAAHYMLLLDFASFFMYQVWTPSSKKGEVLQGLLEQGFEDD